MMNRVPYQLTHLSVDDVLIKIWGIVDKDRSDFIQNVIDVNTEQLRQGYGMPQSRNDLMPGKLVLAWHDERYHRAEIIRGESSTASRKFCIRLIDVGSFALVSSHEIRNIEAVKHLNGIPDTPLAEDFILHEVVASKAWSTDELNWANCVLQFHSEIFLTCLISSKPIINVAITDSGKNKIMFNECLVNRGLADKVHPDQHKVIIINKYGMNIAAGQFHVPPPNIPRTPHVYPHLQQQFVPTAVPPQSVSNIGAPPGIHFPRVRTPRINPQVQILPQQYGIETLPENSTHEVYVSHVIDGMQSFTVQLKKNVDEKLTKLMAMINNTNPEPFTNSLLPGNMCLGKFSEDRSLCRAVVSTVLGEGANLYFVDFGNSEIVPFNEIYKIPPEFIQENVMALRFTLANLSSNYSFSTQEAQTIFANLVVDAEKLLMQVTKPEMPLKQYCELFLVENGKPVNIKNRVLDKVKLMKPAEFQKIQLKQNSTADVVVSFVESPLRFFVQIEMNQSMLDVLMTSVEEYCVNSEMKDLLYIEDVNENIAVCALYSEDNKWYRGLIMDEPDADGNVLIFYVDYGNEEFAHFSKLRVMNNEMISKFPRQAIECRLDIDSKLALKEDVVNTFVEMVNGNSYTMKVKNILPGQVYLVELIDEKGQNVHELLMKKFDQSTPPTVFSDHSSKSLQAQGSWRERSNSSNNENFSAFRPESVRHKRETNDYIVKNSSFDSRKRDINDVDESDDAFAKKEDFWGQNSRESKSRYPPTNRSEQWRDSGSKNKDDTWEGNQYNEGGNNRRPFKSYEDGFNNRNSEEGSNRRPYKPREDSWKSDKENSWKSNRNRDGGEDNSFRRDDRKGGFNKDDDVGGERKSFRKRDDSWNSESKKDDDWKSKPSFNRGGRDNAGWDSESKNSNDWKNKSSYDRGPKQNERFGENKNDNWGSSDQRVDSNFGGYAVSLLDGYDKGAQFVEGIYEENQKIDVIISWFVNPVNFYVMPAQNEEFRQLMEKVQADYPKRKSVDIGSLLPNDSVMARDKDNVIYRARFLRTSPRGALVTFVDYGNNELVKKDQIWTINRDDCVIPVQAIHCGLHNVLPANESEQWSGSGDLDKYFGKNKYTVTLKELHVDDTSSKTWLIDLEDEENQNISDLLVSDGFAVKKNILSSENLYEIGLLQHQILTVYPGHIESSKKFFVHIEPPKVEKIRQAIASLVEKSDKLKSLPIDKIIEGEFCLAQATDEEYYRSLILSVDDSSQQAHILYIDYGDENDVAVNSIKILPEDLMIFNCQIVECSLYEGESFTDETAFIDAISEKDFIIKVIDVIDERLIVSVYDINGARLPYPVASEEKVLALCPLPVLKSYEKVIISHINDDKIYIQRSVDEAFLLDLCNKLNEKYDIEETEKVSLEPDTFYAAKSGKFESWYRCTFLPESNEVFYLDYGNTESFEELLAVQPLDKIFFESPAYCIGVRTAIKFTADVTPFMDIIQNIVFNAVIEKGENNEWFAELKCEQTGKRLLDIAVEAGCGTEEPKVKSENEKSYVVFENWQLNTEMKINVSHVNSPTSFYIQSFEDFNKINTMQQQLQIALRKVLPIIGDYKGLCAIQKSDNKWYRALVNKKGEEAFAIDYGFSVPSSSVKKLPQKFLLDVRNYIVECALNIEPINSFWPQETVTRLTELVNAGNDVVAKLEFKKSNKYIIDLMVDGSNVNEIFVNENLAKWKSYDVIISHATSLTEFYVQEKETENLLYDMIDQLKNAENWDSVEVNVGDIVAAQFVDDEQWYRASVIKIEDSVKYVRFIDYGNEAPCEHFRALPDSLKTPPSYAVQCKLHPLPEEAEKLNETFVEFVNSNEGSYTVYFLSRVEPMLVMLYYNGIAIEEAILKSTETAIDSLPKLVEHIVSDIVYDSVVITHINSPSSFYVQAENVPLAQIENALIDAENKKAVAEPTVGDLVAALFPADGVWYRAKITKISSGVITVLFVDYGNSCDVEQLRYLPESIQDIPYLTKHCAFSLPDGLQQWPEGANERFEELTCDGNTIFKFQLKEEGDPAYVQLQDNGVNVADELATLCKADLATPVGVSTTPIVTISHLQNLDKIWIQEQTPQLDEMVNEMANAGTFDTLNDPAEEMLVAAMFDEDGGWYRAKVMKANNPDYHVLFIDYGNESDATEIKSLPEDLVKLPPLAKCCRLKELPLEVADSWPIAVFGKLKTMVDEGVSFTLCDLIENEIDGVSLVSLRYEGDKDLAFELKNYYETIMSEPDFSTKKDEETLKSFQNEKENYEENISDPAVLKDVIVIQDKEIPEPVVDEIEPVQREEDRTLPEVALSSVNDIDTVGENDNLAAFSTNSECTNKQKITVVNFSPLLKLLVQDQSPEIDRTQATLNNQILEPIQINDASVELIVAALSTDDNIWYRAKIIDLKNSCAEVLFIDYGITAIVFTLAKVPIELLEIPPFVQAYVLHCPDDISLDPQQVFAMVETKVKFCKKDEFEIHVLNEKTRSVNLFHNGVNVLDDLVKTFELSKSDEAVCCEIMELKLENKMSKTSNEDDANIKDDDDTVLNNLELAEIPITAESDIQKFNIEDAISCEVIEEECTPTKSVNNSIFEFPTTVPMNFENKISEESVSFGINKYDDFTNKSNNCDQNFAADEGITSSDTKEIYEIANDELFECETEEHFESAVSEVFPDENVEINEIPIELEDEKSVQEMIDDVPLNDVDDEDSGTVHDILTVRPEIFDTSAESVELIGKNDAFGSVDLDAEEKEFVKNTSEFAVSSESFLEISDKMSSTNSKEDRSIKIISQINETSVKVAETNSKLEYMQTENSVETADEPKNETESPNTLNEVESVIETILDDVTGISFKQNTQQILNKLMEESEVAKITDALQEVSYERTETAGNSSALDEMVIKVELSKSLDVNILKSVSVGSSTNIEHNVTEITKSDITDLNVEFNKNEISHTESLNAARRDNLNDSPNITDERAEKMVKHYIPELSSAKKLLDAPAMDTTISAFNEKKISVTECLPLVQSTKSSRALEHVIEDTTATEDGSVIGKWTAFAETSSVRSNVVHLSCKNSTKPESMEAGIATEAVLDKSVIDNKNLGKYDESVVVCGELQSSFETKCDAEINKGKDHKKKNSLNSWPTEKLNDSNSTECFETESEDKAENKYAESSDSNLQEYLPGEPAESQSKIEVTNSEKDVTVASSQETSETGSKFAVILVHSPDSFFVRQLCDLPRLREIEEQLRVLRNQNISDDDITIGMIAGTKIQNQYVRVKVLEKDTFSGYVVLCIDYGNISSAQRFFELPEKLSNVPPLVIHCGIRLPAGLTEWPEKVCQKYDDITMIGKQNFEIEILEVVEDVTYVKLFKDGVDINEMLEKLCYEFKSELKKLSNKSCDSPVKQDE